MILSGPDISQLAKSLARWEFWEYVAEGLVVLACLAEVLADFKIWRKSKNKEGDEGPFAMVAIIAGAVLFISLGFEWICLGQVNKKADELTGSINVLATQAKESSKTALINAGAAEKAAETASNIAGYSKIKARDVSKEAEALAVRITGLRNEANAQMPYGALIESSKNVLVKKMSEFVGQQFTAEICGSSEANNRNTTEETYAWATITSVLNTDSKWNWSPRLVGWDRCTGMDGIWVIVSSEAPAKTVRAAKALSAQLSKLIPPQPQPIFEKFPADVGLPPIDKEAPWVMTSKNPKLIAILIAERPIPTSKDLAQPRTPRS